MFRKILIATDFSNASTAALHAGLGIAKKSLARVIAVHSVTPLEMTFESPQPLALHGTEWKQNVEKQLEDFFPSSLYPNSERQILAGRSVAPEILRYARVEQCDLIVVGTHGHGPVGRTLVGSVAQRVTRESEIPVMVVRNVQHSSKQYQGYERILVPTDFSDTSMKAFDLAANFANFLKADLHLMHVVEWPAITFLSTIYPGVAMPDKIPKLEDLRVDKTLGQMLAKKELIGNSSTETRMGDPVDEIVAYAKQAQIDFIVMGTHGRKGLERILLGSTTAAVLSKSEVPVLTISGPF